MARGAARVTDSHDCPLKTPHEHKGGPILNPGAPKVVINGKSAARVGDKASCVGVPPDTIRGGLITVFIQGSPAARKEDKTDQGTVTGASENVKMGERAPGPLTPAQAQWLYDYLASQPDIPFDYLDDGCHDRADRMCSYIEALGVPVEKQWVGVTDRNGPLWAPDPTMPGGRRPWDVHVAPAVPVMQPDGSERKMILDPALKPGGPISQNDWLRRMKVNPYQVVPDPTPPTVYQRGWDKQTGTWTGQDETRDPATTARELKRWRDLREERDASSSGGCAKTPEAPPAHF